MMFTEPESMAAEWCGTVARYKHSSLLKSSWQVANSLLPYFGLWCLMYLSLAWSYWLTLLLAVPTAGFLVRIFIIQHDCGHHSFFASRRPNDVLGFLCGVLTITPYQFWRRTHARHHVSSGNLNHRGYGDVDTLTVPEYQQRTAWGRLRYRLYRHPLSMFFLGASFQFIVGQRFTQSVPRSWWRERWSVYATNLAMAAALVVAWRTIGLSAFLLGVTATAQCRSSWDRKVRAPRTSSRFKECRP
jgi:omega-6 fatty acid desaturase (delta-12 desaturase)